MGRGDEGTRTEKFSQRKSFRHGVKAQCRGCGMRMVMSKRRAQDGKTCFYCGGKLIRVN